MFSNEPRFLLRKHQLADVICQLRFPEILAIEANAPVDFQEAIRANYPQYTCRKEPPAPKLTGIPGNFSIENQKPVINHQFSTADGCWRINLTGTFISLTCTRYTCWEEFAKQLDTPLAAFIQIYKPAYFQRVGLRYLNFFSRMDLQLEGVPFSQLLQPAYLGLLADEDVPEYTASRSSVDAQLTLRGGCKVSLHAGPGIVKKNGKPDKEIKFILDLDLFMDGNIPVNLSAGALQTLHSQAWSVFRGAVTDTLWDAMDPKPL